MATMDSVTQALLVGAFAFLVIYLSRLLFSRQELRLPPGPTPLPIIGSVHLLGSRPHQSLASLAQKHGPVMSVHLGQRLFIVATSPDAAKEFLKFQDANFSSRPSLRVSELILPQDIVLNDMTPVIRHLRKILVRELVTAKRLEESRYIRTEEIAYMLRKISKEAAPIQVRIHLNTMATNILSRMILGKRFLGGGEATASEIQELMAIVAEESICFSTIDLQDFFNLPKWFDPQGLNNRFRKLRARMDAFYTSMTNQHKEERRKNPLSGEGQKTLLDVLLEQLDNQDHVITDEHIKGVIWDALSAGTDTTMVTSEWTMAEVLRNPAVVKKARAELDRVVGVERIVQESDIPELKYTQAIVKEALRLHPPLPLLIPHQNADATQAFGYDIPAKTRLFVNVWALGRDPEVWEKPLEFRPERFLDGAPHSTTGFQGQHFELLPFGAGRRLCPGISLATITAHLQVANLLHAFDWSLPDGMTPEELDVTEAPPGLTLHMQNPLVAVAKPRLPSHLY